MSPDQMVQLSRQTLEMALWLGAPLLVIAAVISLLINVAQVLDGRLIARGEVVVVDGNYGLRVTEVPAHAGS